MAEIRPLQRSEAEGGRSLRVEDLTRARRAEWDAMVAGQPFAHFFHSSPWMEVLRRCYDFEPLYLVLRDQGKAVAMVPMVEVKSRFTGNRGVSLPFADECPPLVQTVSNSDLIEPLAAWGRRKGWHYFEVRGTGPGLCPAVPSVSFYGHEVTLSRNEGDMFQRLKSPVRTAVRKAESGQLKVEVSDTAEALREFHRLYCLTRRRHGLPPQPWSFFDGVHQEILARGLGKVFLAKLGARSVAGAVFFQLGPRALFKYGAFDTRFQNLRANNVVVWTAMKWYGGHGCSSLLLGRTSRANEGLRRFKTGWGGTEYAIDYTKYDLRRGAFVTEKDLANGWYNWLFRAAPLWASGLAGKILYKHWA